MKNQNYFFLTTLFSILLFSSCTTQKEEKEIIKKEYNQEDFKGVENAILNYVEALYLVDSTKIIKSVDPKLRKIGFWYHPKEKAYRDNLEMTHEQLVRLAARWNSDSDQADENSPKKIEIFDVNSKTASAKLTAVWGIDLFHLAKVDNQWKIVNVIWQSQPKAD
ncbi:nuclear transport factor 2 family protein [Polaribacter aestuariivivens]|uniref:Nuclear transport factor 2 family protein n=1 Tax=Polaribacter aestuariivivens TaxID=2304626 RepID=A0A5S3N7C8_9FLAO|nr:nuclear transport factor 2 family protein [Polaribacter aestuariivivens]TMM28786.1 nuclear transport factor 2 family protein [Polaribacter aestuariivivens]